MPFEHLSFLWPALLGGVGVALTAGPMGAFMVWRRLAYFSDTIAHSGLLGVTLALIFQFNVNIGIALVAVLISLSLFSLSSRFQVAQDTLLGILSHTSLALGLVLLSLCGTVRVDVLGLLYGDILSLNWQDVVMIYAAFFLVLLCLWRLWTKWLQITVDVELAQVEGLPTQRYTMVYHVLLALVIAVSIKLVGVLLMTALLLIPPTVSRAFSKSPEHMAVGASVVGALSVMGGLMCSYYYDIPTGPAIVLVSAMGLILPLLFKKKDC